MHKAINRLAPVIPRRAQNQATEIHAFVIRYFQRQHIRFDIAEGGLGFVLDAVGKRFDDPFLEIAFPRISRGDGFPIFSIEFFARVFVQLTNITPHEFIARARLDIARQLLESTRLPLKTVAFENGFVTAERMHRIFIKRLRVTPNDYRMSFSNQDS